MKFSCWTIVQKWRPSWTSIASSLLLALSWHAQLASRWGDIDTYASSCWILNHFYHWKITKPATFRYIASHIIAIMCKLTFSIKILELIPPDHERWLICKAFKEMKGRRKAMWNDTKWRWTLRSQAGPGPFLPLYLRSGILNPVSGQVEDVYCKTVEKSVNKLKREIWKRDHRCGLVYIIHDVNTI